MKAEMKYTPKQLRALKKKFTPLPYADKLKFWDEYFSELHGFYNYFYTTIYFDDVADTERMKPENFISLYPKDKQEKEQFNRWVLNSIQRNPHYNFENLKENYFDKITNNPRPIEYTEQEIKGIEKQRDEEKKYMDEGRDIPSWGYYYGYQSVVQSIDVTKEIEADTLQRIGLSFAKGIVDAHYLGFLEKQLEQIKQGKEIMPQQIENNSAKSVKHISDIQLKLSPFKLEQLPANIYAAYFSKDNEPLFHSLIIEGQEIQIFRMVSHSEILRTQFKEMHLAEYAKGFTEAMKYEFIPTINTPENIKEMVLTEVQNGSQFGFPERVKSTKEREKYFDAKDVFEYGFRVGKIYKAWGIISETPKYFEDGFPNRKPDAIKEQEQADTSEIQTKTERIKSELGVYGFFNLPMVKQLTQINKDKLLNLIASNDLPYSIAMFDFLGYTKYLEAEHFPSKYKLHREISKWFNSDKEGRTVKGNISALLKNSKENKTRYTSHLHKEKVKKDYQQLK